MYSYCVFSEYNIQYALIFLRLDFKVLLDEIFELKASRYFFATRKKKLQSKI